MQPNPVLKKLGLADTDRVAIIHTDDIGMCQASVTAYKDLWEFGIISSGSTMVPCPWFLHTAKYCREHPEVDMGVHLTLTSEWETYRWGSLSTRDPASGLLDEQGFFYHNTPLAQEHADSAAAITELNAQVERAKAEGVRPTHLDTHMGTVAHMKFIPGYVQMGFKYRAPIMMMRLDEAGWMRKGLDGLTARVAANMVDQLEEAGMPLLDQETGMNLDHSEDRLEQIKYALDALPAGVTHFIIHPSADTPELRAITPDWPCRVADYLAFQDERLRQHIQSTGLQVIGYRALQNLMPAQTP